MSTERNWGQNWGPALSVVASLGTLLVVLHFGTTSRFNSIDSKLDKIDERLRSVEESAVVFNSQNLDSRLNALELSMVRFADPAMAEQIVRAFRREMDQHSKAKRAAIPVIVGESQEESE